MLKRIFAIAGLACGILILILGTMIFGSAAALEAPQSAAFGADFYTYIYQGVRVVADSTGRLIALTARGLGALIIAVGLTDICFFGYKLAAGVRRREAVPEAGTQAPAPESFVAVGSEPETAPAESPQEPAIAEPETGDASDERPAGQPDERAGEEVGEQPAAESADDSVSEESVAAAAVIEETGGSFGDSLDDINGENYRVWRAPSHESPSAEEEDQTKE